MVVLASLLEKKKKTILDKWFNSILDTYPADGARAFKQDKDRFSNPIGYTISQEIGTLYEAALHGTSSDDVRTSLDNIIRIRAVQDFAPSQAISFIYLLKKIVRDELENEIRENRLIKELLEFESRIDELALLALDIYVGCREKVYELTVKEVKAEREMVYKLLERTNLIYEERTKGEPDFGCGERPIT